MTGFNDGPDSRRAATHRILIPFSDPAEWADMLIRARGADEFLRRREEVKSWLSIQLLLPLILSGVYPPVSTPVTTDPAYSPLDLPLTGPAPAASRHYRPFHIETHPFIISPSHPYPIHTQSFIIGTTGKMSHNSSDTPGGNIPRCPAERALDLPPSSHQYPDKV